MRGISTHEILRVPQDDKPNSAWQKGQGVKRAQDGNIGPTPSRKNGVSDGIRTRDRSDHNRELYQLSYAHHNIYSIKQKYEGQILIYP